MMVADQLRELATVVEDLDVDVADAHVIGVEDGVLRAETVLKIPIDERDREQEEDEDLEAAIELAETPADEVAEELEPDTEQTANGEGAEVSTSEPTPVIEFVGGGGEVDAEYGAGDDLDGATTESTPDPTENQEQEDPSATESDEEEADGLPATGDYGTFSVRDYALVFRGAVEDFFERRGADRVTVRERDGQYELAEGESEDWPDYALSTAGIQVGGPGKDVLGVEPGDEVRAWGDGDVVRLEVLDGDDGAQEENTTEEEEPEGDEGAVGSEPDHEIGDTIDEAEAEAAETSQQVADDGAVELRDGITAAEVHDVLDRLTPNAYLGTVAEELGVDRDAARTIVFKLGRYSECLDAENSYIRGDD